MSNEKSEHLPSYAESVDGNFAAIDNRPGGQRILDQLTSVRAQHVRSIVDDEIIPVIERRARRGLSQTAITLIPSNPLTAGNSGSSEFESESSADQSTRILGLASDEDDIEQIQLQGDMNRYEFWRQRDIVQDLQRVLEDRLSASPSFFSDSKSQSTKEQAVQYPVAPLHPPSQKPRGFFSRKPMKPSVVEPSPVPSLSSPSREHLIDVRAGLEEICLRTVSSFGLYETISRPAVVVRVRARC